MNKDLTAKEISEIPADIQELLGKAPVLSNENLEAYKALLFQTAESVAPIDIIEWFWINDVVYHTWDILRLRTFKVELVKIGQDNGYMAHCEHHSITDEDKILEVKKFYQTSDKATAAAFISNLETHERLDALLRSAESRRNAALHEIERHRQSFASRLGKASDDIIDGEFTEPQPVPAASGQGKTGVLVKKGTQISPARVAELMKASFNPGPKKGAA
jgi:hypothetical protein